MKNITFLVFLISVVIFFFYGIHSQASDEEVKPVKVDMVEKVEVRLLLIDAVVEDRKGEHVRGLTKDDFHLFVDGFEKSISVFEEHSVLLPAERTVAVQLSDDYAAKEEPRFIIFCFGPSRPAWGGPYEAVKAAKHFVRNNLRDSDSIMVVSSVNDIIILQDFTNDPEKLIAAIDMIKEITPLHYSSGVGSYPFRPGRFGYEVEDDDMNNRIAIRNFQALFGMLSHIRERKAVVYFCAQLYLTPTLSRMINEANSARVSIYTVDMVGLTAPGERRNEPYILNAFSSLSIDTGGKVLKWSNDLTRYIPVIEKDLSCYYIIGFYLDKDPAGKQHSLSLIPKKFGLRVRARTGFLY